MKNEPAKETQKGHFFDLIKQPAHPLSGPRPPASMPSPASSGYSGKQFHSRNAGGASGRHGGRSR